jgi:aminopeptidase C
MEIFMCRLKYDESFVKHVDGTMGCNNDDDNDLLRWKEGSAWRQKGFSRLEGGDYEQSCHFWVVLNEFSIDRFYKALKFIEK